MTADEGARASVLLAHDWCKVDYKRHRSKKDLRRIAANMNVGYEMSTSLLIDASTGASVAPMQMPLKAATAAHRVSMDPPKLDAHRLEAN